MKRISNATPRIATPTSIGPEIGAKLVQQSHRWGMPDVPGPAPARGVPVA